MAVPKRKVSKSKSRSRKAAHKTLVAQTAPCPECGESRLPHRACPACGYYRGRQVVTVDSD